MQVETNSREASDLVTMSGILWILFLGILPAFLFIKLDINWQTLWREIRSHLILIATTVIIALGIAGSLYKKYASFGRNNKQVIRLVNPTNVVNAAKGYLQKQILANRQYVLIDPNAVQEPIEDEHPLQVLLATST